MKNPAFYTASLAIGDCISATPTIRKISEVYNSKVVVFSHHPAIFDRLPYVERSEDVKDFITLEKSEKLRREYDLHYSFWRMGQKVPLSDDRGIEMKHSIIDIRQYHAIDNGFTLLPSELHCDFVADLDEDLPNLPEKYVCLHPFKNWPSRTWAIENWENLIGRLVEKNIPVVLIGKDSLDQSLLKYLRMGVNGETDERVFQEIEKREKFDLKVDKVIDLTNKTSISQAWRIMDKASAVVTMDSGILHLAGTTNTHIIQLGSSINPFFRAPYRHGTQNYKYSYVHGSCDIFCASNMKYSLRDWENGCNGGTPLQCVTLIDSCLENKKEFECHPGPKKVLELIQEIWETEIKEQPQTIEKNIDGERSVLIKIQSKSLGDQIGAMSVISEYAKNKSVSVICSLDKSVFDSSYPDLQFLPYDLEPIINTQYGYWEIPELQRRFVDFKRLQYKFDRPLMKGYAEQLSVENWGRPKIDLNLGPRPIKSKYVCFSIHSTAQAKHWNYPGAWDKLCRLLRKEGITPVCIDRHFSFGIEGCWNEVPNSCVKKQNMNLSEMTNYIHHSEFFIGISSGLSWVAHSLGKKVVMISGVTSEDNEFQKDTIKIMNKKVCHGCINKEEISFDAGDWLWCPLHKGTERQFECTASISPEEVFRVIKENLL